MLIFLISPTWKNINPAMKLYIYIYNDKIVFRIVLIKSTKDTKN